MFSISNSKFKFYLGQFVHWFCNILHEWTKQAAVFVGLRPSVYSSKWAGFTWTLSELLGAQIEEAKVRVGIYGECQYSPDHVEWLAAVAHGSVNTAFPSWPGPAGACACTRVVAGRHCSRDSHLHCTTRASYLPTTHVLLRWPHERLLHRLWCTTAFRTKYANTSSYPVRAYHRTGGRSHSSSSASLIHHSVNSGRYLGECFLFCNSNVDLTKQSIYPSFLHVSKASYFRQDLRY